MPSPHSARHRGASSKHNDSCIIPLLLSVFSDKSLEPPFTQDNGSGHVFPVTVSLMESFHVVESAPKSAEPYCSLSFFFLSL